MTVRTRRPQPGLVLGTYRGYAFTVTRGVLLWSCEKIEHEVDDWTFAEPIGPVFGLLPVSAFSAERAVEKVRRAIDRVAAAEYARDEIEAQRKELRGEQ